MKRLSAIWLLAMSLAACVSVEEAPGRPDAAVGALTGPAGYPGLRAAFPARSPTDPTGSEFLMASAGLSPPERERAILGEILAGNVPSHLRDLVAVPVAYRDHRAIVYVLPDYLALGADDDYIHIPMAPRTALAIARRFGFTLPTRKLVDLIYAHSSLRLVPETLEPGALMTSNAYYREHARRIQSQLPQPGPGPVLMAGHKKDIVITPRLAAQPGRVAIYGWHRLNGEPIQPLSLFHHQGYVDYSHGVRLISRYAVVDGVATDLGRIFADDQLSPLVSDEGCVAVTGYL